MLWRYHVRLSFISFGRKVLLQAYAYIMMQVQQCFSPSLGPLGRGWQATPVSLRHGTGCN
jgi:hypothetical protein